MKDYDNPCGSNSQRRQLVKQDPCTNDYSKPGDKNKLESWINQDINRVFELISNGNIFFIEKVKQNAEFRDTFYIYLVYLIHS